MRPESSSPHHFRRSCATLWPMLLRSPKKNSLEEGLEMISRRSLIASGAAAPAAAAAPRFTLAAGPEATVKIGFIDSQSGVFSDIGAIHKAAAELALADMNAKSGRVKVEVA